MLVRTVIIELVVVKRQAGDSAVALDGLHDTLTINECRYAGMETRMTQHKKENCELQIYLTATRNDTYIAQVASAAGANAIIAQI